MKTKLLKLIIPLAAVVLALLATPKLSTAQPWTYPFDPPFAEVTCTEDYGDLVLVVPYADCIWVACETHDGAHFEELVCCRSYYGVWIVEDCTNLQGNPCNDTSYCAGHWNPLNGLYENCGQTFHVVDEDTEQSIEYWAFCNENEGCTAQIIDP